MAEGQITGKQIIDESGLNWGLEYAKNIREGAKAQKELIELAKEFNSLQKDFSKVNNTDSFESTSKRQKEAIDKTNIALKESERVKKRNLVLDEKLKQVNSDANKEIIEKSVAVNKENAALRQQAKTSTALNKVYLQLTQKYSKLNKLAQEAGAIHGTTSKEFKKASAEALKYRDRLDKIDDTLKNSQRNVGRYNTALSGSFKLLRQLSGALGVTAGIGAFFSINKAIFQDIKALDGYNKALKAVGETEENYRKNKEFLRRTSEAYGVEILSNTKQFTSYLAALKGTNLEGEKGIDIYEKTIKVSSSLARTQEETAGILNAFTQIISKGTVQAEELRGQLGDRLPGAFNIMARAIGVSTEELNDMLKNGEVLADEVLPKFAKELERTFGADKVNRIENLQAAQNRLSNKWINFLDNLEQGDSAFSKAYIGLFNLGSAALDLIAPTESLTTQFEKQADEVIKLNKELNPLLDEYDELKSKSSLSADEQKRLKILINDISKIVPTAITAFDEYGNALDISSDSAREFISTQKALLTFRNQEAIKEQKEQVEDYTKEIKNLQSALNNRDSEGALVKQVEEFSVGLGTKITKNIRLSADEITKLQIKLSDTQNLQKGALESIERLSGDYLDKYIKREEQKTQKTLEELQKRAIALKIDIEGRSAQELRTLIEKAEENNKKLTDAELKAIRKRKEDAQKTEIEYSKLLAQQKQINLEDELKNEQLSVQEKLKLADELYKTKVNIAFLTTKKSLVAVKEGSQQEKNAIQDYKNDVIKLEQDYSSQKEQIVKDEFKSRLKAVKEGKEAEEKAVAEAIEKEAKKLKKDNEGATEEERLANLKAYEDAVIKIKQDSAIKQIEIEINKLRKIQQDGRLTPEQQLAIEKQINDAEVALSDIKTKKIVDNAKKQLKAEKELQDFRYQFVSVISDQLAQTLDIDALNIENFLNASIDLFTKGIVDAKDLLEALGAAAGVALDIGNYVFAQNIANIEAEIEENNRKHDEALAKAQDRYDAEGNLLENKENQRKLIEEARKKQEKKLEDEKKREQIKQFKFEKALALTKAGIAMALAILNAAQTQPYLPLGLAMTVAAGILGTIQIAAIASAPTPKFRHGTKRPLTKDTLAITGDGGKHEPITMGNKLIGISPNTDTLTLLPKGAEVHSSWDALASKMNNDEMLEMLHRASFETSLQIDREDLNNSQARQRFNINYDKLGLSVATHLQPLFKENKPKKSPSADAIGQSVAEHMENINYYNSKGL